LNFEKIEEQKNYNKKKGLRVNENVPVSPFESGG